MAFAKFRVRGFRPPREALLASLGALERKTLEQVWLGGEMNVRDMVNAFDDSVAYTTVMTTMDRLYKKGYLDRRMVDRAYIYRARHTPEELERGLTGEVINGLIDAASKDVEPVLACIVDAVTDKDRELLDRLERLVKEKKESLKRDG